jgi:hypothetical protein
MGNTINITASAKEAALRHELEEADRTPLDDLRLQACVVTETCRWAEARTRGQLIDAEPEERGDKLADLAYEIEETAKLVGRQLRMLTKMAKDLAQAKLREERGGTDGE